MEQPPKTSRTMFSMRSRSSHIHTTACPCVCSIMFGVVRGGILKNDSENWCHVIYVVCVCVCCIFYLIPSANEHKVGTRPPPNASNGIFFACAFRSAFTIRMGLEMVVPTGKIVVAGRRKIKMPKQNGNCARIYVKNDDE